MTHKLLLIVLCLLSIFSIPTYGFDTSTVLVMDSNNKLIFSKNGDVVRPIASITKLMTAMVILDAHLCMTDLVTITDDDMDTLRHSSSRVVVGSILSREQLLRLSLMSSDNRAAHALARTYPGGLPSFIKAMNEKSRLLGMTHTQFYDPTGLTQHNTSTARDLVKMVNAASEYETIHKFTTTKQYEETIRNRPTLFKNTNSLVRNGQWDILISKTGYIKEAGRCLVMKVKTVSNTLTIILLDSKSVMTRVRDAIEVRHLADAQ